jgi:hypothetical protein
MGEKSIDLRLGHFGRMPDVMEENVPFHPLAVGAFGSWAVVAGAKRFSELIQELRRPIIVDRVGWPSVARRSI